MKALEWLMKNNKYWMERSNLLNDMRENLHSPRIIDQARNCTEQNDNNEIDQNNESEVNFEVFFPDGTVQNAMGGEKV